MNRRRFLVCPLMLLLLLLTQCSGTGSSKPPLRGADRDRFAIVAKEVLAASSFTILEGLPRPMDLVPPSAYDGGGDLFRQLTAGENQRLAALSKRYLQKELASKTTTSLHGYHFYEGKSDASAAEIETLRALCSSRHSFAPYGGPRFCGGFHPDSALVWRREGRTFQFLICLGCDEVKIFGPHVELRLDIRESALSEFEQILLKYRNQHRSRGS